MKKNNKGFTLVELLAVIIVLTLIMAIAIPSVLDTMNQARKESFYLYAQSLQSKALATYTANQDENDQDTFECVVYDIEKDLDIKNTGDYEGWVKVSRDAIKSDTKRSASITVSSTQELEYVKYCVAKGDTCTPNKTFGINEGDKTATVTQSIGEKQTLCVNYQIAQENKLIDSETKCLTYSAAKEIVQDWKYNIILTFKSNNYGVSEFNINEDEISKKKFYAAMDDFTKASKSKKVNPMAITGPKCNISDPDQIKGTTTVVKQEDDPSYSTTKPTTSIDVSKCPVIEEDKKQFNIILNPNNGVLTGETTINQCVDCDKNTSIEIPSRDGYIFEGWYYDKAFSKQLIGNSSNRVEVNPKHDSQYCISGYNDVYLYAKWKLDESKTTTPTTNIYNPTTDPITSEVGTTEITRVDDPNNTRQTTNITTTTTNRDITDHTLLLDNMNIAGYPIDFSPIKFNYEITVPNSQNNINLTYKANTPDQTTVTVTGNERLEVGDNLVLVKLTNNTTGKEGDYRIVVSKLDAQGHRVTQPQQPTYEIWDPSSGMPDPKLDESNASLKSLMVSGYSFIFDPNVYNYQLDVYNLNDLLISYETASKGAFVNITGNENLKDGDVVSLYVQSPNGYYHKEYSIQVNYKKLLSNNTKYLRSIVIILTVILIATLIINASNKKHHRSIIKKKNDNDGNNNMPNTSNNPIDQNYSNPNNMV